MHTLSAIMDALTCQTQIKSRCFASLIYIRYAKQGANLCKAGSDASINLLFLVASVLKTHECLGHDLDHLISPDNMLGSTT